MFTKWDQVEQWIRDNGFKKWIFYKNDPERRDEKANDRIADSSYYGEDIEDKLAMTKKYLENAGGRAFGVGFNSTGGSTCGVVCEVRLEQTYQPAATSGIGGAQDIEGLRDSITREVRAQIKNEQYEAERKAFEKEKKEFEEKEHAVWGLIVNKLAPAAMGMLAGRAPMRNVAGVDTEEPVHAAPIVVDPQPKEEKPEDAPDASEQELIDAANNFTDEEAEELNELMSRFKKVEPDYLKLLRRVVEMAESGDSTYEMAKKFLV